MIIPIRTATNTLLRPIRLGFGLPGPLAISPDSAVGYVAAGGAVIPVDLATGTVRPPVRLPAWRNDYIPAFSADGRTVYALRASPNMLYRINVATGAVAGPVRLGSPSWMAGGRIPGPGGKILYVLCYAGPVGHVRSIVFPVRSNTGAVGKPIRLSGAVVGMVFAR